MECPFLHGGVTLTLPKIFSRRCNSAVHLCTALCRALPYVRRAFQRASPRTIQSEKCRVGAAGKIEPRVETERHF